MSHVEEIPLPSYRFLFYAYSEYLDDRVNGMPTLFPRLIESVSDFLSKAIDVIDNKSIDFRYYRILSQALRTSTKKELTINEIGQHLTRYLELTQRLADLTPLTEKEKVSCKNLQTLLDEAQKIDYDSSF